MAQVQLGRGTFTYRSGVTYKNICVHVALRAHETSVRNTDDSTYVLRRTAVRLSVEEYYSTHTIFT